VPYPSFERELEILRAKVPGLDATLAEQICRFMQVVRAEDFYKRPGVAESIDWARALVALHRERLDPEIVEETLGAIFKYNDDIESVHAAGIATLLGHAGAAV
jgi:MoxR-like ATPase